jgi:lipid-A-disaccharide synthase
MRYYIIAGEASGDMHGANLIKELKKIDSQAEFRVWGGDLMQTAGAELVKHYKHHSIMGFQEVIKNYKKIKQNFNFCKINILEFNPHVIIFIDYSGFNLRMAKIMKPFGYKLFYYIAPQVWAWREWRVKTIKRLIDKAFVILPFEKEFYKKWNYEVNYVGHPLLDEFENRKKQIPDFEIFKNKNKLSHQPIIALLPGSRTAEISTKLPIMLAAAKKFTDYQIVIAGAPSFELSYYQQFITNENVKLVFDQTYILLAHSTAALVTSGTAVLETALFKVPQVVCFITSKLNYILAKNLLKIKYVSLVNLIMDKPVNLELLQYNLTQENLTKELDKLLNNQDYRKEMINNYNELYQKLGGTGASKRAAEGIYKELSQFF